jgi:hypothetical protein
LTEPYGALPRKCRWAQPKSRSPPVFFSEIPENPEPSETIEVSFGYKGHWLTIAAELRVIQRKKKKFTPPKPDAEPGPEPTPEEDEPGMRAIMCRHTSTVPDPSFIRPHSQGDLCKSSTVTAPKTDDLITAVTQLIAPENAPIQSLIDRASLSLGIEPRHWETQVEKRLHVTSIYCSSRTPRITTASIHFGNQEWAGKVNNDYPDSQLVREAQAQLEIEGTWRVRVATVIDKVHTIEAERIDEDQPHSPMPETTKLSLIFEEQPSASR